MGVENLEEHSTLQYRNNRTYIGGRMISEDLGVGRYNEAP